MDFDYASRGRHMQRQFRPISYQCRQTATSQFGRPITLGERHLIRRINGLIAEEYHQVIVESVLDLGKNIVI